MSKISVCHFLCCLVAILSWQVSAISRPLASIAPITCTAKGSIGSRRGQGFVDAVPRRDPELVDSILTLRGGDVGSIVSGFNDYIGASKSRSWAVLVFSILTDTLAVALMKQAQLESSAQKLVLSFLGFFLSLAGFGLALKSIDVSIAYAIWASVGTAVVSVTGVVCFGEHLDTKKILCLAMILLGVVGLELADGQ